MNNTLISVIVPVYKTEKYLDKCVESIVNQTYKNLEIILVDDGSPDGCPQMCDEWAEKDSRIKVIHKENGGAASARNKGLDAASGDYIGFVDSDDYIETEMFEKLLNALEKGNAQISICANDEVDADCNFITENRVPASSDTITPYDCFLNLYGENYSHCIVPNKLYRKEIWSGLRFPVLKMCEDEAVLPYVYAKSEKIAVVNEVLYHYYVEHSGSVMNKEFSEDAHLVYINLLEERFEFFKALNYDDVYYNTLAEYLLRIRGAYLNISRSIANGAQLKKTLKDKFRSAFIMFDSNERVIKIVGKKKFFMLKLFYFSPFAYKTVVKILG